MFRHRRVRLLWSPAHSRAWPFVVAKATQVCRRNRNQPDSDLRATALVARSDHPSAAGESSAPSVTLPPTLPPAIVWCGDTPVPQLPGDRREQHKTQAPACLISVPEATSDFASSGGRKAARVRPSHRARAIAPRRSVHGSNSGRRPTSRSRDPECERVPEHEVFLTVMYRCTAEPSVHAYLPCSGHPPEHGHAIFHVQVLIAPRAQPGRRRRTLACCARPSAAGPVVN